ncbi:MAG: hypothetical protein ACI9U1_001881 [Porticoccaceae bacterium]
MSLLFDLLHRAIRNYRKAPISANETTSPSPTTKWSKSLIPTI